MVPVLVVCFVRLRSAVSDSARVPLGLPRIRCVIKLTHNCVANAFNVCFSVFSLSVAMVGRAVPPQAQSFHSSSALSTTQYSLKLPMKL